MKIVWLSDMDLKGSGYANISAPVCSGLIEKGYEVKAVGLGYKYEEHHFPFQLLPARNLQEACATILNLQNLWGADAVIVALDIPIQERILNAPYLRERKLKYVGLFPVESDPICFSWAMVLAQMDKQLVISQFGTEEAKKVGIDADYVQVGLDLEAWAQTTPEQKSTLRTSFGFDDDTFVVLTVADNQERKNLVAAMDMFAEFSKDKENVHYILVTREHNPVGWKLRDYAQEIGISEKLMIFERGMSHRDLWVTYAISDVFLLTSKAEGLGMPLLEAMAVGIPCIATDCCGMKELLADRRGFLIRHEYTHRDPFGNGYRYWIDADEGKRMLRQIYEKSNDNLIDSKRIKYSIETARKYVEGRTWNIAVDQVEKALLEACGDENES
jgi:glycosyltransferase involved in cell wall biosynthesis